MPKSRILVLEDDVILALDATEALEEIGVMVIGPAHRVSTAMALLDAERPDAAMLDVNIEVEQPFERGEIRAGMLWPRGREVRDRLMLASGKRFRAERHARSKADPRCRRSVLLRIVCKLLLTRQHLCDRIHGPDREIRLGPGQTVNVPLKMDGFSAAVAALAQKSRHE